MFCVVFFGEFCVESGLESGLESGFKVPPTIPTTGCIPLATAVMSVNKDNTSSSPIDCLIPDTTRTSRFFVRSLVLPIGMISDNVSGVRTDARTDATASATSRLVL